MNKATRQMDEDLGDVLALTRRGLTVAEAARRLKLRTPEKNVSTLIDRVRLADLACGDDPEEVARHYPPRRVRQR